MKIDWMQVIEGWRNNLIPPKDIRQLIKDTASERMEICNACEWNSINHGKSYPRCMECGCPLSAKTKCLSCSCPLSIPKWEAVLTIEQQEEIDHEKIPRK